VQEKKKDRLAQQKKRRERGARNKSRFSLFIMLPIPKTKGKKNQLWLAVLGDFDRGFFLPLACERDRCEEGPE
jgi:hypothetical protein